jgi:hypothetical protein
LNYIVSGSVTAGGASFPIAGTPSFISLHAEIGDAGGTSEDGQQVFIEAGPPPSGLSNDDVTGTGNLNFALSSELDIQDAEADSWTLSADAGVSAFMIYDYIPTVTPEPSFLAATGGLSGVLLWVGWRKNVLLRRKRSEIA